MKVICFDLDDTLYKEMDYLKSAYREIAAYATEHCYGCQTTVMVLVQKGYEVMMKAYRDGGNAFVALNEFLGLEIPLCDYLSMYRNHIPDIRLTEKVESALGKWRDEGHVLGLITDGRKVQQRHKMDALGLGRFIREENVIISEEFGSEKPCELNYRYFMNHYPEAERYVYVGDNTAKDFVTPNRLDWLTVGLRDQGENIHPQNLSVETAFLPQVWVDEFGQEPAV